MLHPLLIEPSSIVVVGATDNLHAPGGKALYNLITHGYKGDLYGVNPKKDEVQGIKCYRDVRDLPPVDVAIIAVAAKFCTDIVKVLAEEKNTKGFILYSAGFSELDEEGKRMEEEIAAMVRSAGGTLLGPNNIGLMNRHYAGVFTTPVPELVEGGVDFISGSGATAVFIIEAAMRQGLRFHSVFTVGNSPQTGVEDVLAYFDETYEEGKSSRVIMMYMESVKQPAKLLHHARSLYSKGVRIVAVKAGSSQAGSRAASSHTGAMTGSDVAVSALFRKAGIIRCKSRGELINTAAVLMYPPPPDKRLAVITHAGGPAVMLTDALSEGGWEVPEIRHPKKKELLEELHKGSSVDNPIDFLATGTAEQLEKILDYTDTHFDEIDAMAVIFGSPGLFSVRDAYSVLLRKMRTSNKPVYPVLPSVVNAREEIEYFISEGNPAFYDEVDFARALSRAYAVKFFDLPATEDTVKRDELLKIIGDDKGYLPADKVHRILKAAGIPVVEEFLVKSEEELEALRGKLSFPVVMKVTGVLHKTEVNGVRVGVEEDEMLDIYRELRNIPGCKAVNVQRMLRGRELFAGVKKEDIYGHLIVFGAGGTAVEVENDLRVCLAPVSKDEVEYEIRQLRIYPLLKSYRNKPGINMEKWVDIICRLSQLTQYLPEISELDLNPLIADDRQIAVVDARINISN